MELMTKEVEQDVFDELVGVVKATFPGYYMMLVVANATDATVHANIDDKHMVELLSSLLAKHTLGAAKKG